MTEVKRLAGYARPGMLMRIDSATLFKRFFYLERALTVALAAWIPGVSCLQTKAAMARAAWQNAMTADALRSRIFELRYPDRNLERAEDEALVALFEGSVHAPSGIALLLFIADHLAPALKCAYESYLAASDPLADGPTHRFLEQAVREKHEQIAALRKLAIKEVESDEERAEATRWISGLGEIVAEIDIVRSQPMLDLTVGERPRTEAFRLPETPARDPRYLVTSFYWPDNFDPNFAYGDGYQLQLRTAVSHLNEVWAVETAGAILHGLADTLGWEWIFDAARWLVDESRHMVMGQRRLELWGFEPSAIPLGDYIYTSCRGEDIIYRMGMLAYFETKNIGKKRDRTIAFRNIGDRVSERDMDFDWADEAIHAQLGRKWMKKVLKARGGDTEQWKNVVDHCEALVTQRVQQATEEEKQTVCEAAAQLIKLAETKATIVDSRS